VQAISDHKFHVVLLGCAYHRFAIFLRSGHRFLAQHVNACVRGAFRMFAVENVRRRNVSRINLLLFERLFQVVVGVGVYAVALTQFAFFLTISGDERHRLRILRVLKRRQHCCLRDVAQPNNGVANFSVHCAPSFVVQRSFALDSSRAGIGFIARGI